MYIRLNLAILLADINQINLFSRVVMIQQVVVFSQEIRACLTINSVL